MNILMRLLHQLDPRNGPPSAARKGILAAHREMILQYVLDFLLGIYTVFFALILLVWPEFIRPGLQVFYVGAYIGLFAITVSRQASYIFRSMIVIGFMHITGAFALASNGLVNFGWLFLFAGVLLSSLLLGRRAGGWHLSFTLLTIVVLGALMVSGVLPPPEQKAFLSSTNPGSWFVSGFVFFFTAAIVTVSVYVVVQGMDRALRIQEKLTNALAQEQEQLEKRVEERSADLRERVSQFEVASQIARQIAGEMNLDNLLTTAVNLIRENFGFYHVGVFFNDKKNEYAVLRAATGEAGRQMLERGHRLKIGEIGLVGYAVKRGEARIAADVAGDAFHYKNPLLPDTRSEMALPLRTGDRTIGALDVQSVVDNAFTPDGINILQTIADQLAIAFQKIQLVEELQRTVEELEINYQAATHSAWAEHLKYKGQKLAYRMRDARLEPLAAETGHGQEALSQGRPVFIPGRVNEQGQPAAVLAVPIKLRNEVLGVVDVQFDNPSVAPDLVELIEATVNRLAISLDNARLFETTASRAEREKKVADITARIRSTNDPEEMMRIAVSELQSALRATRTQIFIRKQGENQ